MKRDYFKSIDRKDYWIKGLVSTIGLFVLTSVLFIVGQIVGSFVLFFIPSLLAVGFYIYYFIGLIVGRLKNIGADTIWILGVLIVPFAWIVIGLLPSKEIE